MDIASNRTAGQTAKERTVDAVVSVAHAVRDDAVQIMDRIEALARRLGHFGPPKSGDSKAEAAPSPTSPLEKISGLHQFTNSIHAESMRLLSEIEKHI